MPFYIPQLVLIIFLFIDRDPTNRFVGAQNPDPSPSPLPPDPSPLPPDPSPAPLAPLPIPPVPSGPQPSSDQPTGPVPDPSPSPSPSPTPVPVPGPVTPSPNNSIPSPSPSPTPTPSPTPSPSPPWNPGQIPPSQVGYGARCTLHTNSQSCFTDLSCFWCKKGNSNRCMAKYHQNMNSTLLLASCEFMYYNLTTTINGSCDTIQCLDCSNRDCFAKVCGYPDGAVSGTPTRMSCNPWEKPCYWCSTDKDQGSCYAKLTDCISIQNSMLGKCNAIDCVTGDQYDGNLLLPHERSIVFSIRLFSSFMSLFATTLLMIVFVIYKKLSFKTSRLVFFLAICNFLISVANLFSLRVYNNELKYFGQCYAQGTLLQFSEVATFGWVLVIIVDMYLSVIYGKRSLPFEIGYHICVWLIAILAAALPWINSAYGIAGLWCWIIWEYQIYRWTLYYLPLFIVILCVLILYSLMYVRVLDRLKIQNKEKEKEAQNLLSKLQAYPIIFTIVYLFSIVNRIYDWASPDDSFPLYVLESLSTPLIGFINSVYYLSQPEMRVLWKKQLFKLGCCISLTAPTAHEEFEDDETQKNDEINFDVPDETQPPQDDENPDLF